MSICWIVQQTYDIDITGVDCIAHFDSCGRKYDAWCDNFIR